MRRNEDLDKCFTLIHKGFKNEESVANTCAIGTALVVNLLKNGKVSKSAIKRKIAKTIKAQIVSTWAFSYLLRRLAPDEHYVLVDMLKRIYNKHP